MGARVLMIVRRNSAPAREAARELKQWLKDRGHEAVDVTGRDEIIPDSALAGVRLGVVIGGDGTFLSLVRRLEHKDRFPLLGVNLGTLGFITETTRQEMLTRMEQALDGGFEEQKRLLLDVELWREGKCVEAGTVLNETAITKDARTHMLKFDVFLRGQFFNRVGADGYIVSTPTGSTAYALSAGGPILQPEVNGIVLVPVCSHALSARPVVIPHHWEVRMELKEFSGKVYLVWDGQINHQMRTGDQVIIRASRMCLRMVQSSPERWAETLRTKLHLK